MRYRRQNANAAAALAKGQTSRTALKIIPAGEETAALASLPLSVLDLTEEQKETLSLWGIHTLGMLANLPEEELITRMGQAGQRLRQLARGELPHSFQPNEPAFIFEEHMELDSPVKMLDAVLFVANVMLDQLIRRAESRVLALGSIDITLTLEGLTHTCTVRPALPSNERRLWITPQLPEPARLDVTLARIRAIVGEGCVGRPVLIDTNQPQGFRVERFVACPGTVSSTSFNQPRSAVRKLRPAENISVTVQFVPAHHAIQDARNDKE